MFGVVALLSALSSTTRMAGSEGPNASDSPALDSHASGPEEPVEPAGGPLQEPVPQEEGAADSAGGH